MINHCVNCNHELIKRSKMAYERYFCNECNKAISNKTLKCKKHPNSTIYGFKYPKSEYYLSCKDCGFFDKTKKTIGNGVKFKADKMGKIIELTNEIKNESVKDHEEIKENVVSSKKKNTPDILLRELKSSRVVSVLLAKSKDDPLKLIGSIMDHIEKYNSEEIIQAFKKAWMNEEEIKFINEETGCDKWVEKNKVSCLVLWTLSYFLQNKTQNLTFTEIANTTASLLSRKLTNEVSVSDKSFGTRLEKPEVIKALELVFQLVTLKTGTKVFEKGNYYINVYYDWFYLVQSGKQWKFCSQVGKELKSNSIKIGVGFDYSTGAIVSLVMHGKNTHDSKSMRNHLMLKDRPGIIHVSDLGGFSTETMMVMKKDNQHFIITLKKNVKYEIAHPLPISENFKLDTAGQTKIIVLKEAMIRLNVKPELGDLKYIKIKYKSPRSGKFETKEIISSLSLSSEEIVKAHSLRWAATEIEFRTLQHYFGLEKINLNKPEKAWPLLLLTLTGKMLMELTYRAIHMLHGGQANRSMLTASFGRGFNNFITAVLNSIHDNPIVHIEPCSDQFCSYRRKLGQRRK